MGLPLDDQVTNSPIVETDGVKVAAIRKQFYLKSFGCQMNVYDSERMMESLAAEGYAETQALEDADLVILNTCHIREKAAEKVYSDLGRIRDVKLQRARGGRDTVIAVTGCIAQAEGAEISRRQPAVDLVVGPQSYHKLPHLIRQTKSSKVAIVETDFAENEKFKSLGELRKGASPAAFLTIQEGCDKFCTFCVVPYTRGQEFSRPVAAVVAEARSLINSGASEITLLGQNVNAYHGLDERGAPVSLAGLIDRLAKQTSVARLRYMTSHPRDMADDLIEAHVVQPALMPFLHLPVQSGSDRILAAMNRKHTAQEYMALIARVRSARPDIALSSDFIVGFPGESDADFEATLDLVRAVTFAQAFSFKYSTRPGTPAADLAQQVPEDVKTERLQRLQHILEAQQLHFNAAHVGQQLPVLFERTGRNPGMLVGRTPYLQLIHVAGDSSLVGTLRVVTVTGYRQMSLTGELASTTDLTQSPFTQVGG